MYHIKSDLRAHKSAALLYEGYCACLDTMPPNTISISDVTKAAGVVRATFYRNFDELIDILHWQCDSQFKFVLTDYVNEHPYTVTNTSLLLHVFQYSTKNIQILELLLHLNRMDIIINSFSQNASIIMDSLKPEIDNPHEYYDYFISIQIGIFVTLLVEQLQAPAKTNFLL